MNRIIIELQLTAINEAADVEYKTNGVRVRVDTDTNFTAMVHLLIRGGLGALACDDHIPTLVFEDTSSDESADESLDEL